MNHNAPPLKEGFKKALRIASLPKEDEYLRIKSNIKLFLDSVWHYNDEAEINTPETEKELAQKFRNFLEACHYYPALKDFDDLLKFKSDERKYRSDGTINWYHEFLPIVNELCLILAGKKNGGYDLSDLETEGGLSVKLSTIINHDNLEDRPITKKKFAKIQRTHVKKIHRDFSEVYPNFFTLEHLENSLHQAALITRNVWTVTKKSVNTNENGNPKYLADGKLSRKELFPSVRAFINNIVRGKNANPVSYAAKLADVTFNIATLTNSEKHSTQKKLEFCNNYEDLCGSRMKLTRTAIEKWTNHADDENYTNALDFWDNAMGSVLYLEFSWLEFVEYSGKSVEGKYQPGTSLDEIYPWGIDIYLDKYLSIPKPRFASPLHIALDRKRKIAETNPQARACLERSVFTSLERHKEHFPEIFVNDYKLSPRAGRGAVDKRARAPVFL